jgi:Lipase (class 3)
MAVSPQFAQADALLTLTLSVASYIDERPLPGESIAHQEARMLSDINAALCASTSSTWSVVWGPKLNADRSNMMYIAGSLSTGQYAVAIRGTDWTFLLDWLEDLASVLPLVPYPYLSGANAKVAAGTYVGLLELIQMDPASFLKGVPAGSTIYVTGHSLGGCLASAIAPYLAQELGGAGGLRVYTFAAPSAGDAAFASAYNGLFGPTGGSPSAFRFFNTLDAVPNGWASLSTIETYYQPVPSCPQDLKDLINFAQGQVGSEYVQVGSANDGTAIALPGHLIFFGGGTTAAIDPIGDALFLYEVAQQHHGSTYQALLQSPQVPAEQAKLRGFVASRSSAAHVKKT